MTRKIIALAMVMTVCSAALFAQEAGEKKAGLFSIGAGALFTSEFGGGTEFGGVKTEAPWAGGGGFIFVDATYAEFALSIWGGGGKNKADGETVDDSDFTVAGLNIGLLGKYPIALNPKMVVFPMVGIDYMIMLSVKDKDGNEMKNADGDNAAPDSSALWIKFGGGLDYKINTNLYFRAEALYGIRLPSKAEKDETKDAGSTVLGHGLTVKAAIGYAF